MLKAIEIGYVQQEIQNAAYAFQQAVDSHQAVIVGVNQFQIEEEKSPPIQRVDEALERQQVERVRALRARRDGAAWKTALQCVEDAARSGDNLMPQIVSAVENYATLGEISDTLRLAFGEHQKTAVI